MSIKKHLLSGIGLVLVCSLTLLGCGNTVSPTKLSGDITKSQDSYSAVVSSNATSRTLSFPKMFQGDSTAEQLITSLNEKGYKDVQLGDDGEVLATLSIEQYNELIEGLHKASIEALDAMSKSEDSNISSITYDEGFSKVEVHLKSEDMGFESFGALFGLSMAIMPYQQLAGLPVSCDVQFLNKNNEEVGKVNIPKYLETMDSLGKNN